MKPFFPELLDGFSYTEGRDHFNGRLECKLPNHHHHVFRGHHHIPEANWHMLSLAQIPVKCWRLCSDDLFGSRLFSRTPETFKLGHLAFVFHPPSSLLARARLEFVTHFLPKLNSRTSGCPSRSQATFFPLKQQRHIKMKHLCIINLRFFFLSPAVWPRKPRAVVFIS